MRTYTTKEHEILTGNILLAKVEKRKFYGKYTIDDYGPATLNNYPPMLYREDWNWLIGFYNHILKLLISDPSINELFKNDKNCVVQFGTKNFFGLFEGQLHIESCWIKAVDFAKFYLQNSSAN